MRLLYPAVFYPCEESNGYTVVVPDLPGCVSEGNSLADAIVMGTDAALGWVLDELESRNPVPKASAVEEIVPDSKDGIVRLLILDVEAY